MDSINEITKQHLYGRENRNNKLVIVKCAEDNFLTFLVADVEVPQIPGYPACSVERFDSLDKAVQAIKDCYVRNAYIPDYPDFGYWTVSRKNRS